MKSVKFDKYSDFVMVGARVDRAKAEAFRKALKENNISLQSLVNAWIDNFLSEGSY